MRRRTDHKQAAEVAARVIRRGGHQGAHWGTQIKPAMERAGLKPSTFAIWNLKNAGRIKRISRGIYRAI